MKSLMIAGAAALVLLGCASAAELTDADKAAFSGTWMLAEDDPLAKGDEAGFYASYALTLNLALGGGYLSEGISPGYGWSRISAAALDGDTLTITLPGDDAGATFTMSRREADMVTLSRGERTMTFQRVRPAEDIAIPAGFEALALRLQQTSDAPPRFVALVEPGEDKDIACADDTRQTVEFDLLSPFAHTVFVKKDIDLAGYGISDLEIDMDGGVARMTVRAMQAGAEQAETWSVAGIDGTGPITISPLNITFADCTGGLK